MATTGSSQLPRSPRPPRASKPSSASTAPEKPAVKKTGGALAWTFKPFVNVTGWLGLDAITSNFRNIKHDISFLTTTSPPDNQATTFEELQRRLKLSDAALARKAKDFARLAGLFALFGFILLFYAMYLGWQGDIFAFALTIAVAGLAFANGFRFHFWLFQIKSRKLGCTLSEWFDSGFKGEK